LSQAVHSRYPSQHFLNTFANVFADSREAQFRTKGQGISRIPDEATLGIRGEQWAARKKQTALKFMKFDSRTLGEFCSSCL
jgi:hypothetical protein